MPKTFMEIYNKEKLYTLRHTGNLIIKLYAGFLVKFIGNFIRYLISFETHKSIYNIFKDKTVFLDLIKRKKSQLNNY